MEQLVDRGEWEAALPLALDLELDSTYISHLAQQLLIALLPALDVPILTDLSSRVLDKAWLAGTCLRVATSTSKVNLANKAVELGIQATTEWVDSSPTLRDATGEGEWDKVEELAQADEEMRRICRIRRTLFELGDKVKTWDSIWGKRKEESEKAGKAEEKETKKDNGDANEGDEDHGWDNLDLPTDETASARNDDETASDISSLDSPVSPDQPSLTSFLTEPLHDTALSLAAFGSLSALEIICHSHSTEIWPYRIQLLEAVPEWIEPEEYIWLLPAVDSKGHEADWSEFALPWRTTVDWSEKLPSASLPSLPSTSASPLADPRTSDELTSFYIRHIERIASLGFVHSALSLVQHGASRGVMDLDQLGEELSLLTRLVYDRPTPPSPSSRLSQEEDLTLSYWRSLTPEQVIRVYLAYSDSSNLATSIRRLVLPYLSVLESRLERAGTPDPTISTRLLYDYILSLSSNSKDLNLLYSIFESSKPTLPSGARIVKDDKDLARLAIASLYGSSSIDEPSIVAMGKIFECLPAFSDTSSSPHDVDLFSLATTLPDFSPKNIFSGLKDASPSSLSYSLDLLDLHLSQLETFSRYSCATPLSWFLVSHNSITSQRAWATRLARTAASGGGGFKGNAAEFESEDEWLGLGEVLKELTDNQGEEEGGKGKKGTGKAFWLLNEDEIWKIFFGGLLGAGRKFLSTLELMAKTDGSLQAGFSLARSLFNPSSMLAPLEPGAVEDLVVSASREFYDNAEEGNINRGDMKMAFDW